MLSHICGIARQMNYKAKFLTKIAYSPNCISAVPNLNAFTSFELFNLYDKVPEMNLNVRFTVHN